MGESLLIRGGGTHARFGNRVRPPDAVVDLTGLDSVIAYSSVDLTLAVEAGVRLSAIDRLLAENDQRLAVDAPHRDATTIGGLFASGLSGPRRLRYGSLKDMVIGTEVISSRGSVTKSGGMVVKNVSGYELSRLHYGAHGAFGVVSRVNLKVIPAVESRVEAIVRFERPEDAHAAGVRTLRSVLDPAAIYIVTSEPSAFDLHMLFEGANRFAREQAGRSIDLIARNGRESDARFASIKRSSIPEFDRIASLTEEEELVVRLSVPASQQAELMARRPAGHGGSVLADLGSGLMYLRSEATEANLRSILALGAPATILAAPDTLKPGIDVHGPLDEQVRGVLRALKDQYDPDRTLNRGRFAAFL